MPKKKKKKMTVRNVRTKPEPSSIGGQLMYVKCSDCGSWMDVKPGGMNQVSHSLCSDCFQKQMKRLDHLENEERNKP